MQEIQNSPVETNKSRRFLSLRWKILLPIFLLAVPVAMLATYMVSDSVARELRDRQSNQLIGEASMLGSRAATLGENQVREAQRVAFTANIPSLVLAKNNATLQALVQPLAAAGDLDYLIIAGADGKEIVGLQRDVGLTFMASQDTLLEGLAFIPGLLKGSQPLAFEIDRAERGYILFTAVPITYQDKIVGFAAIGITLERALRSFGQVGAIYSPDGRLLALSGDLAATELSSVSTEVAQIVLGHPEVSAGHILLNPLQMGETSYQAVYAPFIVDSQVLGIVGIFQPDTTLAGTNSSRRTLSLLLSGLVGGILILGFAGLNLTLRRLARVTRTAESLAMGEREARTQLRATDEIGELGHALDVYAQRMQENQDALETSFRQQRRETAQLTAVIESIPDGIIVQDLDGRVVLMNRGAFRLLGSKRVFRSSPLNELTAIVTDKIGVALMPGVFSLGDPQRVPLDGKVLHAQAAAVVSKTQQRVGTVIVLRDVTAEVSRENQRDRLLTQLAETVETTLPHEREDSLGRFVREVNHNAIVLQRMISEIRELSLTDAKTVQSGQEALSAETLLWKIAREWQPTANSAEIELHVLILARGLYILGQEQRLRWAIGNLVDNAIKYTLKGGHVSLALRADENENYARFLIKDSGVGIADDDLPNVFTRFYRGKPITETGEPLQVPGSGQGLFIAHRVIEAHGGDIHLKSTPGHGTEALFRLPLTASEPLEFTNIPASLPDQESVPLERQGRNNPDNSASPAEN